MKYYIWAIIWGALVIYLCLMPSAPKEFPSLFPGADKLAHLCFFFIFNTLLIFGNIKSKNLKKFSFATFIICSLISLILSSLTEYLQWKVFVYRSAELYDLLANYLGIGLSSFCYILFSTHKSNSSSQSS